MKKTKRATIRFVLLLLLLVGLVCEGPGVICAGRAASTGSSPEGLVLAQSEGVEGETVPVRLYDLDLRNQDGSKVSFVKDVIGDRVAVIIPFYTTCTTAYPILVYVFTRLQVLLGDRLGREVVLVSVSVDPSTDIPIRLKAYARRQKARPGWVFLTGDRGNLARVLMGVRVLPSEDLEGHNHAPVTIVGRAGGEWVRYRGFPTPDALLDQIEKGLAAGNRA